MFVSFLSLDRGMVQRYLGHTGSEADAKKKEDNEGRSQHFK
jgi:hypothetical protein